MLRCQVIRSWKTGLPCARSRVKQWAICCAVFSSLLWATACRSASSSQAPSATADSYVNVPWPIAKVFGSYTISPDDVAVVAGSDPSRPFDLITFIHDGELVHDQPTGMLNETKYTELLGKRYAGARF